MVYRIVFGYAALLISPVMGIFCTQRSPYLCNCKQFILIRYSRRERLDSWVYLLRYGMFPVAF